MTQISLNSLEVSHLQQEKDWLDGQDGNFFIHAEEWREPLESVFKETEDLISEIKSEELSDMVINQ